MSDSLLFRHAWLHSDQLIYAQHHLTHTFLIRRRPGCSRAFGHLVLRFRPVTRLAKRIRTTRTGVREVMHEVYLEHTGGSRAEVTAPVFALLGAADGVRPLKELASDANGLPDEVMDELYILWQQRFFTLQSAA